MSTFADLAGLEWRDRLIAQLRAQLAAMTNELTDKAIDVLHEQGEELISLRARVAELTAERDARTQEIAAAIRAAEQAQKVRDCEAICPMCADPDRYYPAEWEDDDNYYHEPIKKASVGVDPVWCDAGEIWHAWADAHMAAVIAGGVNVA
jgi:hypothetical protein